MLKKIVLDYLIPAALIAIFVLAGIYILSNNPLWSPFGKGDGDKPAGRVVDTPEYKQLDSAYREEMKKSEWFKGYAAALEERFEELESEKQKTIIKYNNNVKKIETNTADRNFDDLRAIIRSRREK